MKNLVTELLLRLTQGEEELQDLAAQVETLEQIIVEMLCNVTWNDQQISIRQTEGALVGGNRMPAFLMNMHNAGECIPKVL